MKLIKADSIAIAKFCDETHDYRLGWEEQPEVYEQIELDDMEDIEF